MSKTQAAALTDRSLFHGDPWNERNAEGQAYFEVIPLLVALRGRGGSCMTLSEVMLLLTLLATVTALIVDVVKATFDIAWKISHDKSNNDNKKSK